jgi:hypothetical protein
MNKVVADRTPDADAGGPLPGPARGVLDMEVVIPVYNEERALAASIHRLHEFLSSRLPFAWQITIVDNASTDRTPEIARELAAEFRHVRVLRLEQKGRGRALRAAWSASQARVVAYMDVDLSTDLRALLPLIAPLLSGHSEIAIGSRLACGSRVTRGLQRELISRTHNRILRTVLRARFSDAQCGFKAVRADALRDLLDAVRDNGWFFDTELLVLAQRRGVRIHEVAVDWVDDPDSRVDIVATALADLRGVARLAIAAPIARFLAIGVASTLAYAFLFLVLAGALGPVTASAVALALTNGALSVLHGVDGHPPRLLEVIVLAVASLAATVTRYVALDTWVFRTRRAQECRTAVVPLPTEGR